MAANPDHSSDPGPQGLRADAERNRIRVLDAAMAVFAEEGLDAPLETIARRAGVGIATLYRRFPTRDDLVAASFAPRMAKYLAAAEEALLIPDAWEGLRTYIEQVCGMQAADRGLNDLLVATFPTAKVLEEQRAEAFRRFAELVRRAQDQGALRSDFVPEDMVLLLMANGGLVKATRDAVPGAWRRFVAFMLDGFRADGASPLPAPPSPAQMYRAMRRLGRPRPS